MKSYRSTTFKKVAPPLTIRMSSFLNKLFQLSHFHNFINLTRSPRLEGGVFCFTTANWKKSEKICKLIQIKSYQEKKVSSFCTVLRFYLTHHWHTFFSALLNSVFFLMTDLFVLKTNNRQKIRSHHFALSQKGCTYFNKPAAESCRFKLCDIYVSTRH